MRRTVLALGASVLLGLAGLAMQAQPPQDKKPEPPPPAPVAQQDKVAFPDTFDSWYKIMLVDGTHVGYWHVVLSRTTGSGSGRYVYNEDAEVEMMSSYLADGGLTPYLHVRADLWAKVTRALYYDLVDMGEERVVDGEAMFGVESGGEFFAMADAEQVRNAL